MNQKELKELVEFLIEKDISEFELERGDVKVRIKRALGHSEPVHYPMHLPAVANSVPVPAPAAAPAAVSAPAPQEQLHEVKSPIVGTYYEAPGPGAPPFVKVGDTVDAGQVLCIIEAMKLMNEIESDSAGEIVKKLVTNGQPVEYGQPLFLIRPRA